MHQLKQSVRVIITQFESYNMAYYCNIIFQWRNIRTNCVASLRKDPKHWIKMKFQPCFMLFLTYFGLISVQITSIFGESNIFFQQNSYQSMVVKNGSGTPISETKMSAFSVEDHKNKTGYEWEYTISFCSIDQFSSENLPSQIKASYLHFIYKNYSIMMLTLDFNTTVSNFRSNDRPPTWRIRTKTNEKGESELIERNSECECHLIFDQHVCGDDGITYPSSCTAKCHHVVILWF